MATYDELAHGFQLAHDSGDDEHAAEFAKELKAMQDAGHGPVGGGHSSFGGFGLGQTALTALAKGTNDAMFDLPSQLGAAIGTGVQHISSAVAPAVAAVANATHIPQNLLGGELQDVTPAARTYQQNLDTIHQKQAEAEANDPVARYAGTALGLGASLALGSAAAGRYAGSELGALGDAVTSRVAPALAPVAASIGPFWSAAAGHAATGAAIGAGTSALEGGSGDNMLASGAVGAGAGLGLGAAAGAAEKYIPALVNLIPGITKVGDQDTTKAVKAMSKAIGENPEEIQTARDIRARETGSNPAWVDVTNDVQQGRLREVVADNPEVAQAMKSSAYQAGLDRSAAMSKGFEGERTLANDPLATDMSNVANQSTNGLDAAQEARHTARMNPIRGDKVVLSPDDGDLLASTRVQRAIGNADDVTAPRVRAAAQAAIDFPAQLARWAKGQGPMPDLNARTLTNGDIDAVRQMVGDAADTAQNASGAAGKSTVLAGNLRNDRDAIVGLGTDEYQAAHAAHIEDKNYQSAFELGQQRTPINAVKGLDADNLATEAGMNGYRNGLLKGRSTDAGYGTLTGDLVAGDLANPGAKALVSDAASPAVADRLSRTAAGLQKSAEARDNLTPSMVPPQDSPGLGNTLRNAGTSLAYGHGPAAAAHAGQGLLAAALGDRVPPRAQAILGDFLTSTDPARQQAAHELLIKAGVRADEIERLKYGLAALGGNQAGQDFTNRKH